MATPQLKPEHDAQTAAGAVAFACPNCQAGNRWNHGNATQQRCTYCGHYHDVDVLLRDGFVLP